VVLLIFFAGARAEPFEPVSRATALGIGEVPLELLFFWQQKVSVKLPGNPLS